MLPVDLYLNCWLLESQATRYGIWGGVGTRKYLPVAHLLYYTNDFPANVAASGTSYPAYPGK